MAIYSKFLTLLTGADRTVDLSTNTISTNGHQFNGSTSGALTFLPNPVTVSYTLNWPAAQAAGGSYALFNDGAGNLTWAPASAGANTALSNLAAVAINTSLLPGADNSINLGSASFSWASAFIHILKDGAGINSANPYTRLLIDNTTVSALDWQGRFLKDTSGTNILDWGSGVGFPQLTASTVPYLNGSSVLTSSAVTPTELGYVSGVTSAIQTQINGKLSLSGGTMTGAINLGGFAPTNSGTPVNPNDLVNKSYVDNFINATSWKNAVLVATTANITLSGEQAIDGFTTSASRVLVKNQSTASQNGVYVSAAGAWARAVDMSTWAEVPAAAVFVQEGTVNADLGFVCVAQPGGTLGTTAINFVQFSSAGAYSADGVTLQLISGVFSIKNAGVTETQIASSTFSTTGALNGGSGTKVSVRVDNSTLDINGSNNLEVKAAGVSATQLATGAFDQVTITGGAGTPAAVASSPAVKEALTAGEAFAATTLFAVRFAKAADAGFVAGRVYKADNDTTSADNFYVIGLVYSAGSVSTAGAITATKMGLINVPSHGFTVGAPLFLGSAGAVTATAPSTSLSAVERVGIVRDANNIEVQIAQIGIN